MNGAKSANFKILYAVSTALIMLGCEAPPDSKPPVDAFAVNPAATATGSGSANAAALRSLTNTSNGLEVRRLIVNEQPGRTALALMSHAEGPPLEPAASDRLKRNGWRFVRVRADVLETLIAEMGGASYDANEWHGQVLEWRSLVDRPIDDAGRAVAVDGFVRQYQRGEFRLMMRAWTVPMEDGPALHLEMLPRRRFPQANDLRKLMSERFDSGSTDMPFESMLIDVQLEPGYAYVLTSESPALEWPSSAEGEQPPPSAGARRGSRDIEADPFVSIDVDAPPTLGEFLLSVKRDPPARGVLIFIPRIPQDMIVSSTANEAR